MWTLITSRMVADGGGARGVGWSRTRHGLERHRGAVGGGGRAVSAEWRRQRGAHGHGGGGGWARTAAAAACAARPPPPAPPRLIRGGPGAPGRRVGPNPGRARWLGRRAGARRRPRKDRRCGGGKAGRQRGRVRRGPAALHFGLAGSRIVCQGAGVRAGAAGACRGLSQGCAEQAGATRRHRRLFSSLVCSRGCCPIGAQGSAGCADFEGRAEGACWSSTGQHPHCRGHPIAR